MDKVVAKDLIEDTFQHSFNKELFYNFANNLLNHIEPTPSTVYRGNLIPDAYKPYIQSLDRLGKYEDPEEKKIDILIVHLKKDTSLEHARTMQRNFIAWYLNGSRGGGLKDAALVAFVSPEQDDWRFSFIKMEYRLVKTPEGNTKAKEEFTPAKRYSFLVGKNEDSHTAKVSLIPLLINDDQDPLLAELEDAFSIEKVTKEFFGKYRDLFLDAKKALDEVVEKYEEIKTDFISNDVSTIDFCKKLLGQIVFLYFLQKKGWFGVKRGEEWGTGSKHFLRELFKKKHAEYKNFFNDILEPLFYNTLAVERPKDYSDRFDCKIPFLNGGLFDPINDYDWIETEIYLPDELFSNDIQTKEGDKGTGILDVFDRYNFTVKEDEPLEKEVAVDPEMLGKVFENLLEVKDRKSKGTYYTPREIVHYMCQESLINYLVSELSECHSPINRDSPTTPTSCHSRDLLGGNPASLKENIKALIKFGETAVEHDSRIMTEGRETRAYSFKLPESIRRNAGVIDEKLATIRVCDPAIGSGAFPLGMMSEIVKARQTLTTYIPTLEKGGEGGFLIEQRTPYNFKRHAIHNCLYGVDIDPGAVEIAKLRLWLSLMVDEEDIKHIKPLPNLDYKIMQGNSLLEEFEGIKLFDEKLISSKPFDETQIMEIKEKQSKLQKEFIDLHNRGKLTKAERTRIEAEQGKLAAILKKITAPQKDSGQESMVYEVRAGEIAEKLKKLHEEFFEAYHINRKIQIKDQIDSLEWELIETTLKEHKNEDALSKLEQFKRSNTKPFFLWKLNFSEVFQEKGGFDVVIGNPPYVRADSGERHLSMRQQIMNSRFYETLWEKWDIYIPFIERGYKLLKTSGVTTMIVSDAYCHSKYAQKSQNWFLQNSRILRLDFLSKIKVFEAGVHNIVYFFQKRDGGTNKPERRVHEDEFGKVKLLPTDEQHGLSYRVFFPEEVIIDVNGIPLERLCYITYGLRPSSDEHKAKGEFVTADLVSKKKDTIHCKAYVEGKHLDNWYRARHLWLEWGTDRAPARFCRPTFPELYSIKAKLLAQRSPGPDPVVCYDNEKLVFTPASVGFVPWNSLAGVRNNSLRKVARYKDEKPPRPDLPKREDLEKTSSRFNIKYLLGVMNSSIAHSYLRANRRSNIHIYPDDWKKLLIPDVPKEKQAPIVTLVDQILTAKPKDPNADISTLIKQIDKMVYKLYDLTSEEIAIVEGRG